MTDRPETDDALSFDRAIPVTPVSVGGSAGVTCASCRRPITESYHTANGEPVCDACRAVLALAAGGATAPATIAKALVFGLVATLAGALVYWAVIRFANLEIGLVSILSGWMIGKALRVGADGRGGRVLQVIGALLVYVSVAMAYFPFLYESGVRAGLPLAGIIVAALLQPISAIFDGATGGFLSALIIGFGMMQAWQQARQPSVVFEGPFRVGSAAS